jgi:hypothetical protein
MIRDGRRHFLIGVAGEISAHAGAPKPTPTRRHQRQKHALKTHSYLWIFKRKLREIWSALMVLLGAFGAEVGWLCRC